MLPAVLGCRRTAFIHTAYSSSPPFINIPGPYVNDETLHSTILTILCVPTFAMDWNHGISAFNGPETSLSRHVFMDKPIGRIYCRCSHPTETSFDWSLVTLG